MKSIKRGDTVRTLTGEIAKVIDVGESWSRGAYADLQTSKHVLLDVPVCRLELIEMPEETDEEQIDGGALEDMQAEAEHAGG
jgi:hypothetical protein